MMRWPAHPHISWIDRGLAAERATYGEEPATMNNITHIGLDVHKETIAVAALRPEAITCEERVIVNTPEAIRKLVAGMGDPGLLRACYEAGPTGYDTHRLL